MQFTVPYIRALSTVTGNVPNRPEEKCQQYIDINTQENDGL